MLHRTQNVFHINISFVSKISIFGDLPSYVIAAGAFSGESWIVVAFDAVVEYFWEYVVHKVFFGAYGYNCICLMFGNEIN